MARITVEDCLKKIDSQYDLVLLAKERAAQLNAGDKALVPEDNDKNTVISLREIGEGKISIKNIEDSAINKLRKIRNEPKELEDLEVDSDDEFDKIYAMDSTNYANIISLARDEKDRNKVDVILNESNPKSFQSVPDPYYGGENGFQDVYEMLEEASNIITQKHEKR